MLARHRQLFASAIFLLDGVLLFAAWLLAYWLRFFGLGLAAPLGIPPLSLYLWFGAVLTPVALLILRSFRIYRSARTARLSQELFALLQGITIVTALAALASFFSKGDLSRLTLAIFGVVAAAVLTASRLGVRVLLRALRKSGRNLRGVLVVGTGPLAEAVVRRMDEHPEYGLELKGLVAPAPGGPATAAGRPIVGSVEDLPGLVERSGAELVYLALARAEWQAEQEALERLEDSTAAVRLVPDLARAFTLNASVEDFDGMPVVLVTESPSQGWNSVLKRTFDIVFAGVGLIVLAPVLGALALWVKLDSRGPVLYRQERVGFNGRRFWMLKFRSMRTDAETEGAGWSRPGDPRTTRAGRILRKLSLDELPQLWNVFLGQMSLVGPRPERPVYVEQFRGSIPRYMLRHHVKAGLTGWAQVNGLRGDTPLDQRIEYDLYYVRHWSLLFDVRIILLTLVRVFRDASAH